MRGVTRVCRNRAGSVTMRPISLRPSSRHATLELWTRRLGIYRGEVMATLGALARIDGDTTAIVAILRGNGNDDEGEEVDTSRLRQVAPRPRRRPARATRTCPP